MLLTFSNSQLVICLLAALWPIIIGADDCPIPQGGKKGGKQVPDILTLNKDQNGFSSIVEVMTPEEESIIITENYNGAKLYGSIQINWVDVGRTKEIYYYQGTKTKFTIEDDCDTGTLEVEDKYEVINEWIVPEAAKDELDLFGKLDVLGPATLMIYANSVSNKASYMGEQKIDGRTIDHWSDCLSKEINLDWYFESSTNLPVRFTLSSASNKTAPHVYNFLVFTPVSNSVKDSVQYPIGYGCYRSDKNQPEFPSFVKSDIFSMDAEAMLMYEHPDRVVLSSLRMMKYQGTYSFEINDGFNTTRIIQNPEHMGRYVVNAESGECRSEVLDWDDRQYDNLAASWPYHDRPGFNLLSVINTQVGTWSNYMGQVSTESGTMDVWEDDLHSFFSSSDYMDASVTYYFPAIDRSKKPHQAPAKIVIRPHNTQYISGISQVPYQIEIVILDYTESDIDISDRYDVSGCYDGPGEFTWFQIVMSDPSADPFAKDVSAIRNYFEQTLATFIPTIRIPEIVINLYDFNFYITAKLLERPPFKFYYSTDKNYKLSNPTSVIIRDHLEDCGEVCTGDINCKSFSYCNDFSCQIISSTMIYPRPEPNENCTWYERRVQEIPGSTVLRNTLASTRNILGQIKSKVVNGEFILAKYSLSAEDMFIVSGPEEIGGIEEEFDDSVDPMQGDEYAVIFSDSRLLDGETINSITYYDCIKLCQNDDDCYSLSYCFNNHKECVISTETKANLSKSLTDKTSHADNCDIFEKSFMAFYRKFPGQSLVKDAIMTLSNVDESECARQCYESTDFPCKSFDFCTANDASKTQKTDCFLHRFHAVEDTAHEITDIVWDFSTSSCDHYAVRLSRDYTHYVGHQYKEGSVTIIGEISDVSLERCASDCNSDEGNCISFEYCESIGTVQGSTVKASCRLSSSTGNLANYASFTSTGKTCSIYLNKAKAAKSQSGKVSDHFGVAMGVGSFFFVVAFAVGIVGSIYYQRRFS